MADYIPEIHQATLPNGLTLLGVEYDRVPWVSLTFMAKRGAETDPPGKAGAADWAADFLTLGTSQAQPAGAGPGHRVPGGDAGGPGRLGRHPGEPGRPGRGFRRTYEHPGGGGPDPGLPGGGISPPEGAPQGRAGAPVGRPPGNGQFALSCASFSGRRLTAMRCGAT